MEAPRTVFSVRLLKKIIEEAEKVKAAEVYIELGINRRISFVDKDDKYIGESKAA